MTKLLIALPVGIALICALLTVAIVALPAVGIITLARAIWRQVKLEQPIIASHD